MTSTTRAHAHHRTKRTASPAWSALLKGLGAAMLVTLAGVAIFALLMQWIRPSDQVIRIFNQVLKLVSIAVGVKTAIGRRGEVSMGRGALIGLAYMLLGVIMYAILSGQNAPMTSYLADLGMGLAGGGIVGMLLGRTA